MDRHIVQDLSPYIGKKALDVIDSIKAIAEKRDLRVNLMDTVYNNRNSIDNEDDRLNVRTKDGVITSFTVG